MLAEDADGETALVAKLHHALGDGFALVAPLLAIADERVGDAAPAPHVAVPGHARVPWLPGAGAVAAARDGLSWALALARLLTLPADPPELSPAPLSGVRRVAASRPLPLDALRAAAHRAGATLNDLAMAAVAGGLRALLAVRSRPVDRLRIRASVPVNLRGGRPDLTVDASLGNAFGLLFAELPVHLPTPEARLEAVRRTVATLRARDDAQVVHDVIAACGAAPTPLHHALTGYAARRCSLVLTNVAGPAAPLRIAGRRVSSVAFWVPHSAHLGLGVSVMSYAGQVRIGVRADTATLADPAELVTAIEAELIALGVRPPTDLATAAPVPTPGMASATLH